MRKLLAVIDMQNDFIDGALGTNEAQAIVAGVKEKIRSYPPADIYATRDTHEADYLQTSEGAHLPVEHCIRGTKGWEIREELMELLTEAVIVDKPTFGSTELAALLLKEQEKGDIEIELIGLCTDICVISNALLLKASMPEVKITVDSACCAGVTCESHENALNAMRMCQIEIV